MNLLQRLTSVEGLCVNLLQGGRKLRPRQGRAMAERRLFHGFQALGQYDTNQCFVFRKGAGADAFHRRTVNVGWNRQIGRHAMVGRDRPGFRIEIYVCIVPTVSIYLFGQRKNAGNQQQRQHQQVQDSFHPILPVCLPSVEELRMILIVSFAFRLVKNGENLDNKNPNHISDKKHDSDNSVQQIKPNPYQKRLLP